VAGLGGWGFDMALLPGGMLNQTSRPGTAEYSSAVPSGWIRPCCGCRPTSSGLDERLQDLNCPSSGCCQSLSRPTSGSWSKSGERPWSEGRLVFEGGVGALLGELQVGRRPRLLEKSGPPGFAAYANAYVTMDASQKRPRRPRDIVHEELVRHAVDGFAPATKNLWEHEPELLEMRRRTACMRQRTLELMEKAEAAELQYLEEFSVPPTPSASSVAPLGDDEPSGDLPNAPLVPEPGDGSNIAIKPSTPSTQKTGDDGLAPLASRFSAGPANAPPSASATTKEAASRPVKKAGLLATEGSPLPAAGVEVEAKKAVITIMKTASLNTAKKSVFVVKAEAAAKTVKDAMKDVISGAMLETPISPVKSPASAKKKKKSLWTSKVQSLAERLDLTKKEIQAAFKGGLQVGETKLHEMSKKFIFDGKENLSTMCFYENSTTTPCDLRIQVHLTAREEFIDLSIEGIHVENLIHHANMMGGTQEKEESHRHSHSHRHAHHGHGKGAPAFSVPPLLL